MHNNRDGIESQRERSEKKELQGSPPNSPPLSTTIAAQTKSIVSATTRAKSQKHNWITKKRAESHLDNYVGTIFLHNFMQFAQIQVKREKPESYSWRATAEVKSQESLRIYRLAYLNQIFMRLNPIKKQFIQISLQREKFSSWYLNKEIKLIKNKSIHEKKKTYIKDNMESSFNNF